MNSRQLSGSSFDNVAPPSSVASLSAPETSRSGLERSRITILYGWVISMIGIVLYCFVMSGGDQGADLPSALAGGGGAGWLAFAIIAIGVGVWARGCVGFIQETDLENPASDEAQR